MKKKFKVLEEDVQASKNRFTDSEGLFKKHWNIRAEVCTHVFTQRSLFYCGVLGQMA